MCIALQFHERSRYVLFGRAFDRELETNGMVMLERTDQARLCLPESDKAWNIGTVTGMCKQRLCKGRHVREWER